ncbi:hypothetical protein MRB53_040194 [Persea americana]|nr:hypothetical protein MRB53_040194 [Persea americana]
MSLQPLDTTRQTLRTRMKSLGALRSRARTQISTPPRTIDNAGCLSCIYSPHGVSSTALEPYIRNHLAPMHALPLTLLVHSMVLEQNPWYMGGVVTTGAPGGMNIIKTLDGQVKSWIAAHDEPKINKGISVKLLKSQRYDVNEVMNLLTAAEWRSIQPKCLESGEKLFLNA